MMLFTSPEVDLDACLSVPDFTFVEIDIAFPSEVFFIQKQKTNWIYSDAQHPSKLAEDFFFLVCSLKFTSLSYFSVYSLLCCKV